MEANEMGNQVAFKTSTGNFLTAVNGGGLGGPNQGSEAVALHTDAIAAAAWETFTVVQVGPQQIALRTVNGNYITAVNGGGMGGPNDATSPVHTDATTANTWETFTLNQNGDQATIQTSSGNFVTAVGGGGIGGANAPINSDRTAAAAWETFTVVPIAQAAGPSATSATAGPSAAAATPATAGPPATSATPTYAPKFPIEFTQGPDVISGTGGAMTSAVTIDASGRLSVVTTTVENEQFRGFTGGVVVLIAGADNQKMWASGTHAFGVDGKASSFFSGGNSDRTDSWSDQIPANLLPLIRYVYVHHMWCPKGVADDVNNWLSGINTALNEVQGLSSTAAPLIAAIA
jgi:hypothetical protein